VLLLSCCGYFSTLQLLTQAHTEQVLESGLTVMSGWMAWNCAKKSNEASGALHGPSHRQDCNWVAPQQDRLLTTTDVDLQTIL
jgi:hypothetical protein